MLAARSARNACPICRSALAGGSGLNRSLNLPHRSRAPASLAATRIPAFRSFSSSSASSSKLRSQDASGEAGDEVILVEQQQQHLEKTVREAKQRFRDTLPRGYLTDDEYALYERLYGPPLRETGPEDVGIPQHHDMAGGAPAADGGDSLETTGEEIGEGGEVLPQPESAPPELADGYVGVVARNKREYDALIKLEKDFIAAAEEAKAMEEQDGQEEEGGMTDVKATKMRTDERLREVEEHYSKDHNRTEYNEEEVEEVEEAFGPRERSHPNTEAGRFGPHPTTVHIPRDTIVEPIARLLARTDISHVQAAAQKAFGGTGLPDSAITPQGQRNRPMLAMTLHANQHRMSEIDADAYIATLLPQVYASSRSVLVEVRKQLGTEWLRDLLAKNDGDGPKVLDAGGAGAGASAWQEIVDAEWDVMREEGKKQPRHPPGKKTVVVGSDNLRNRISALLEGTTFLPRLPDYHHSADNVDKHLDAPQVPQARKMYDVILASHLLLQWPEGHRRKAILNNLWGLLADGGVLIILEKGHPRGFEAVAEVRHKLLGEYMLHPESLPENEEIAPEFKRVREPGMIVAPCTNHKECPMYKLPGRAPGRKDVCSFSQRFIRPPFLHRLMDGWDRNHDDIEFSYLAVRRGRTLPDTISQGPEAADRAFEGYSGTEAPDPMTLPRNIGRPLKRHGHVLLDVCTPAAKIERWIIPQSHGRQAYRDARKSRWGDLWALGAKTRSERKIRLGRGGDVPDDGGVRAKRAREGKPKVVEVGY
ncbi:MAG: hypothetical protein IMZ46_17575, partial [Acidobacteria bacterium]|nr:hypothetical protein [Acidobacteriota bacterium]